MEDYPEKRKYPSGDGSGGISQPQYTSDSTGGNVGGSNNHRGIEEFANNSDFQQNKRSARDPHRTANSQTGSAAVGVINATMDCPSSKVGFVIGRKGTAIAAISERSGCRVSIDSNQHQDPRKIYLQGPPLSVTTAMSLISQVLAEGPSAILPADDAQAQGENSEIKTEIFDDIKCPFDKVALLIGHRGQTVHEISKRTGCRVSVIQDGLPEGADREVQFRGTDEQILEAKVLVVSVLTDGPTAALGISLPHSGAGPAARGGPAGDPAHMNTTPASLSNPGAFPSGSGAEVVQEREIAPNKVGMVIGPKGAVLADVKRGSGCKIFINQKFPEGRPHKIIYTGTIEQINAAVSIVEGILNGVPYRLKSAPQPPSPYMGQGLATGMGMGMGMGTGMGTGLSRTNSYGSNNIAVPSVSGLSITASPVASSHEMTLYQSQVQRIIGPNGASLHDLQHRYRVQITFELLASVLGLPGDPVNRVTLRGSHNDIAAAKTYIYHLIGVPDPNPSVPIDHSIHSPHHVPPQRGGAAPNTLALGADGQAGYLEPAVTLPDGNNHQIAQVRNELIGKVIGKQSGTLNLIKSKSGAQVQIVNPAVDRSRPPTNGFTNLAIFGSPSTVQMATQMIQEVLISGVGKLYAMPDVACSLPSNYIPNIPSYFVGGGPMGASMPPRGYPQRGHTHGVY